MRCSWKLLAILPALAVSLLYAVAQAVPASQAGSAGRRYGARQGRLRSHGLFRLSTAREGREPTPLHALRRLALISALWSATSGSPAA